jgi:hypothetical protein
MVTLTTRVVVCDVCKNPRRKTKPYRAGTEETLYLFRLCAEHGAPLDELLNTGYGDEISLAVPKVRVGLTTMEEIEAMKRKKPPTS